MKSVIQSISTERLTLRPLNSDDAEFILALFNQPDCLKFIGDRNIRTLEDAEQYIINGPQKSYQEHGFGMMAITLPSGVVVGLCGILKRDEYDLPDIGYAILSEYYRNGYALESCQGILSHYKEQKQLLALTHPDNVGSKNVLLKLGFQFHKEILDNKNLPVTHCFLLER